MGNFVPLTYFKSTYNNIVETVSRFPAKSKNPENFKVISGNTLGPCIHNHRDRHLSYSVHFSFLSGLGQLLDPIYVQDVIQGPGLLFTPVLRCYWFG
jgi:hypothetical protein